MKPFRKPLWQISENEVTREAVCWTRRRVLAAGGGLAATSGHQERHHAGLGRDDGGSAPSPA